MNTVAHRLSITDVSTQEPHPYPISSDVYHRMGEVGILDASQRTELIDARIIAMAPIGCEHADWTDRLTRLFIKTVPEAVTVRPQNPLYLDDSNEPEPDIALLRPRAKPYREAHPQAADCLLIVEVADTTLHYDRNVKVPLYAQHGIPEVWIIDVRANRLEIYREPQDREYRIHLKPRNRETIELLQLAQVSVDLRRLF